MCISLSDLSGMSHLTIKCDICMCLYFISIILTESYTIPGAKPAYPVQYVGGGNGTFGTLQMSWQVS